jgi:hypothetical protein
MAPIVIAGIVAKGLGIIAGIFFAGLLVGVVLTAMIAARVNRFRRR